jgi:hypothetical protein
VQARLSTRRQCSLGATDHCDFVRADVRAVLRAARGYPGGCHRVILSCPKPFAQLQQQADADEDSDVTRPLGERTPRWVSRPPFQPPPFLPPPWRAATRSCPPPWRIPPSSAIQTSSEIAEILAPGGQLFSASNVENVAHHAPPERARANDLEPDANGAGGKGGSGGAGGAALAASITLPRRQQLLRAAGGEHAERAIW